MRLKARTHDRGQVRVAHGGIAAKIGPSRGAGLAAESLCAPMAFLTQNPAVLNSLRSAWLDVMGLPPILAVHATTAMDENGATVVTPATTSAPSLVNNGIRKLHGTPFRCVWIPSPRCRTEVSTVISGTPSDKLQHFRSLTHEKANQPSR